MLSRLLMLNAGVFLALLTLDVVDQLTDGVVNAVLPQASARTLATSWRTDVLASQPWSVLTHMFTHRGLWHVFMNMLLLYWMGRMYVAQVGSRRLLSTYIGGGLVGNVRDALDAVLMTFHEGQWDDASSRREQWAKSWCKQAATTAQAAMPMAERRHLIQALWECNHPNNDPWGKPTMIHLNSELTEQPFG